MSFWNICIAILVFSLIVIIHEFGHFIVAKWNKVKVIEFSLGMGPRLISWGKTVEGRNVLFLKSTKFFEEHPEYDEGTLYSIKLLPFGGSCMMLGEEEEVEDDSAFGKKSVYARMAIIFAGPFFNFILAFLLAFIIMVSVGYDAPVVSNVEQGMPLAEAGIQEGDVFTEINGRNIVINREIDSYFQFHKMSDEAIDITVERDGVEKSVTVTPKLVKGQDGVEKYRLGFAYGNGRTKLGGFSAVSTKDIAGPVGIVKIVGNTVNTAKPKGISVVMLSILNISILLTANLGVMNLLPIPALDGGRLLFLIVEWIRRKPLNRKIENYVNVTGFMLLMVLMVLILANDVIKLF